MRNGELKAVRLRTASFALLAALAVVVATAWPARASNDYLFAQQWGLQQIGVPAAWSRSTGAGVTIGVVDTGVFLAHEDLAGKVSASTNCINANGDPAACTGTAQDDEGHGTHVSGIAAAIKDNGRGIAGVAPDAKLVVAKALDSNGNGATADVEAGIRWVVQHGAKVVNLSLGDLPIASALFSDPEFPQTLNDAFAAGAIPVVAGGNTLIAFCSASYPSSLNAIVVGATGQSGALAGYSCPLGDAKWGVVAPGGNASSSPSGIVSTYWDSKHPDATNTYTYLAGTSMATPHVSGLAALLLSEGLSRDAVVQRIITTAVPVSGCSSSDCGHGRIDVTTAVATAAGGGGGGGGGGTPAAHGGSGGAPNLVKPPSATVGGVAGTTSTAAPGSPTTAPPGVAADVPGDNPVVAAGAPHGTSGHKAGGGSSGRAGQVALAIGLLGAAGAGAGFAVRKLRAGAAP